MKKRIPGIFSLAGLAFSYWIIRVPLFGLHQMKDWSLCMFILGAVMIVIFGILYAQKALSVLTGAGYLLSFFIGYLFQFDYGIGRNSIWIIWTCSYIVFIAAGIAWDFVSRNRSSVH